MAIKFTAFKNTLSEVEIGLIGDGQSPSVQIDLSESPFALEFNRLYPTAIAVQSQVGENPLSAQLVDNGIIEIKYDPPLDFSDPTDFEARNKLLVRLIYG